HSGHTSILRSFPTRRSSDLFAAVPGRFELHEPAEVGSELRGCLVPSLLGEARVAGEVEEGHGRRPSNTRRRHAGTLQRVFHVLEDRKSTRLNSSHQIISYAV